MPLVQLCDGAHGRGQQRRVRRQFLSVRIHSVCEQDEHEVASPAGQVVDLHAFDLLDQVCFAGEQGRHDHQRAQRSRNPIRKRQPG